MEKRKVEFWYGTYGTHGRPVVWFKSEGAFNHRYIEMNDESFTRLLRSCIEEYLEYGWEVIWVKKED
jgi:hypothetical protein